MEYNGGSVVAMIGDQCVAIACDKRLGANMTTISTNFPKIFEITPHISLGLSGLATDIYTVSDNIKYKCSIYALQEKRPIKFLPLSNLVSSFLYSKR